jgi:2'-5' RNA ligase
VPRSAVVLPVRLPPLLEQLRRRHVPNAKLGVPAHVTLLYPFVPSERLSGADIARLRDRARTLAPFGYRLEQIARWPEAIYVVPAPEAPFDALAAAMAADWPQYPLYGSAQPFAAHVTLAEPGSDTALEEIELAARMSLPVSRRATAVVVLAEDAAGHWRIRERLPLGSGPTHRARSSTAG